jgi:hypothetical protein
MKSSFVSLMIVSLLSLFPVTSAIAAQCESPSDFVLKVYSANGNQIDYELRGDRKYREITVLFFGKKDHVMRANTVLRLPTPKGTFSIPERALLSPAQLWFNFVVVDESGCKSWGLVNEVPVAGQGNTIILDNPSGEGKAFHLRKKG